MFNRKTKELKNDSNLKVQLEMIKEQQRVLSTVRNSYNQNSFYNSTY